MCPWGSGSNQTSWPRGSRISAPFCTGPYCGVEEDVGASAGSCAVRDLDRGRSQVGPAAKPPHRPGHIGTRSPAPRRRRRPAGVATWKLEACRPVPPSTFSEVLTVTVSPGVERLGGKEARAVVVGVGFDLPGVGAGLRAGHADRPQPRHGHAAEGDLGLGRGELRARAREHGDLRRAGWRATPPSMRCAQHDTGHGPATRAAAARAPTRLMRLSRSRDSWWSW